MIEGVSVREQAAAIAAVDTFLYGLEDTLEEIHDRVNEHSRSGVAELLQKLEPSVTALYSYADVNLPGDEEGGIFDWGAVDRLNRHVDDAVSEQTYKVEQAVNGALTSVNQSIASIIPGISEVFGAITQVFGRLIDGLLSSLTGASDFWQVAADTIGNAIAERKDPVAAILEYLFNHGIETANRSMPDTTEMLARMLNPSLNTEHNHGATVEQYMANVAAQPAILKAVINVASLIAASYTLLNARIAGYISGVTQTSLAESLTTPLSPANLVDLLRIRAIGEDFAHEHATRSGLSPSLFDLLRRADERLLDSQPILELWRRTGDDNVLDELYRLGYTQESVAALRTLALSVGTPSDVVRFLVRDVFDPDAVERGKLDEDFDKKYNESAFMAAGVSRELAQNYWRAHWELPSPTQGYQMLHRGELTIEQLRALLKQADYAPGYVEKLINIAYLTPGRIDIRRMYEIGIISTHEELVRYYTLLGYSPEHAETLAVFAERLKVQADEGKTDRRYGHIAGEIVRSFVVGSLSRMRAKESLISLGYSDERAELKLSEGEYARQRDTADRIRDAIGKEYVRGFLTNETAKDKLTRFGFDEAESDYLISGWAVQLELREETDAERHQKDLSKSEILAAYHDGLFERDGAAAALVSLGYDDRETGVLLSLEDAKAARADAKAIEATTRAQFLARKIEADAARSALESLGYTAAKADALMSRWTVEREERRPDISAGQLERMLMQGVIPIDNIEERLRQAGYTDADVNALLTLYGTDMSIAEEKLRAQQDQFAIREARLTQQGGRRLDLTERGQDLATQRASESQQGLQQRFEASVESRIQLQTERLEVGQQMQAERIAAQTERDAAALAASRERQSKSIDAQLERLRLQLSAAEKRSADANAARQDALAQRERLATAARAATDERERTRLNAQAARQQQSIDAADRRAAEANNIRVGLAARHEQFTLELAQVRDEATRLRDIAQEAARARQLGRQEQVQIRKETRTSARRDITAAQAAGDAAELQAVQLQQSAAIADINARFATLQATISQNRQQQAIARRAEAERALASATPTTALLDAGQ